MKGLFDWEETALNRHFRPGARILVAGAGAGREILALYRAGYDADGFDCSPALVSASRDLLAELGAPDRVILCDPDKVPAGDKTYGGVIIGWGTYTHVPSRKSRVAFLEALHQRVQPQSPLLVSFFTELGTEKHERIKRWAAVLGRILLRGRREGYEMGDCIEWGRFIHRFSRDTLEEELGAGGFNVLSFESSGTWGHAVALSE